MKPNILFITTDQQRPELGVTGHPCLRTPHLDMLSKEGIIFNRAYTDCPVCIPARTTMITGIQSHKYGKPEYCEEYRINRGREKFLGSLMTKAGYQTRLIGKTHWHTEPDFRAGFETVFNEAFKENEHIRKYGHIQSTGIGANELSPTLSNCPEEMQDPNWCIGKSIDFLDRERESSQPFFLWTSIIRPHPSNAAREPYYSMYNNEDIPEPVFPEWSKEGNCPYAVEFIRAGNAHAHMTKKAKRKARGVYYGMITQIDHQLGRLFGALTRHGLWDNTIVIFTTDHGEHLFDYGTCFKGTFLEPSARLPFIARFPKNMKTNRGNSSDALIELADLLPTFCEIADIDTPEDITGKSIMPLVYGNKNSVHDFIHGQIENSHMFHNEQYKYLYFADDGAELLFDKSSDKMDEFNLAGDETLIEPLRKAFIKHLESENHKHIKSGKLLNLNKKVADIDRTNVLGWMGLASSGR